MAHIVADVLCDLGVLKTNKVVTVKNGQDIGTPEKVDKKVWLLVAGVT